jgi:hypothetical protein
MCTIHGFQEFILPCWHGCYVCKLQVTHKHMAWHATHCLYSPVAIIPHHMNPCMHAHSMYVMSWYHICMSTLACQSPMGNIFPFQISHLWHNIYKVNEWKTLISYGWVKTFFDTLTTFSPSTYGMYTNYQNVLGVITIS